MFLRFLPCKYFGIRAQELVKAIGGRVLSIEGSETPTRSYVINFNDAFDSFEMEAYTEEVKRSVIDAVLDDILEDIKS